MNLPDAQRIKAGGEHSGALHRRIPDRERHREALDRKRCDAVTIARPLIANNDLVKMFAQHIGRPPKPCTYCNKCLVNAVENPLGCYEESRFPSREEMMQEIMTVFEPPPFQ